MHTNVALPSVYSQLVDSYCTVCIFITDINVCFNNNGGCSHDCVNTVGSHHCTCSAGYVLLPNNHTCEGEYIPLHIIIRYTST